MCVCVCVCDAQSCTLYQSMVESLGILKHTCACNQPGAINTLMAHGSEDLKKKFLPKLVSGEWTGTMCLTEPQCGSDLAQVRTKAVPSADGTYKVTGKHI